MERDPAGTEDTRATNKNHQTLAYHRQHPKEIKIQQGIKGASEPVLSSKPSQNLQPGLKGALDT